MQENARLLMEETGCEQGEAELALELAGNNLEKAVRTIGSLLRHIAAVKGKISFPGKNLYGLLLIVVNSKTREILRLRTVLSYNPALYEQGLETDWYTLEKRIFSYRLDEGSLPDLTQGMERKIRASLMEHKDILVKCAIADLERHMVEFFAPDVVELRLSSEELNLRQFRQMPDKSAAPSEPQPRSDGDPGAVCLQVDLMEDKNGREASRLAEGDTVMAYIIDPRDIAHYLAHLIGGRRDGTMIPLPATVKQAAVRTAESEIRVYFAPGIVGVARVKNDLCVKLVETKTQPWWKKISLWP
jgi:hypothetical protein